MGAPRMYFLRRTSAYPDGCHEVLTDIRSAKRVVGGTNADGSKQWGDERDDTVRDHLLDGVKYSCGMRPALGIADKSITTRPGEINYKEYQELTERQRWHEERDKRSLDSGHYGY